MERKPSKKPINHHRLDPTVRIGKDGITQNIITQIKEQLRKKGTIKVKFFASGLGEDKKAAIESLAAQANATIVHQVGFVVVLERIK